MRKLDALMSKLDEAKELVSEAEDRLNEYLKPIVKAHEGKDRIWGGFHELWRDREGIAHITFRHEASGGPYDDTYRIPLSVFDKADADAVAAANQARLDREARKIAARRAQDEAAFEALRIKLGK